VTSGVGKAPGDSPPRSLCANGGEGAQMVPSLLVAHRGLGPIEQGASNERL
jgi:hypothetical protein